MGHRTILECQSGKNAGKTKRKRSMALIWREKQGKGKRIRKCLLAECCRKGGGFTGRAACGGEERVTVLFCEKLGDGKGREKRRASGTMFKRRIAGVGKACMEKEEKRREVGLQGAN